MQTKLQSLTEAWTNTALAFVVSTWLQQFIMREFFDLHLTVTQSALIVAVFTLISVARNYIIRRTFNAYQHRSTRPRVRPTR